jgi:hypothetical protein
VCAIEGFKSAARAADEACASAAARRHGCGVENSCCIAAVEDLMEAFHDCFEEAVDLVWASELEEGAENLRGAERGSDWRKGRRIEVVDKDFEGEDGVWKV